MLNYSETPFFELRTRESEARGVRLLIKREDQNHPFVSGNKWWKLKYNLQEAVHQHLTTVLTFGGAYSNHIYATAAAAHELGLKSIGIIRGEQTLPLNVTLSFAKKHGMQLHYISREDYRKKSDNDFIGKLHDRFGSFYLIPEGGTNELAIKGCAELGRKLMAETTFDFLFLPVGTAGTMAGIVCGLEGKGQVAGVSVLKNGAFLEDDVNEWQKRFSGKIYGNTSLLTSYDHGGYAKVTTELLEFIRQMKAMHNLPLDQVYTGKLLWAVMEEIRKGTFRRGATVLALHTGGLQGATL